MRAASATALDDAKQRLHQEFERIRDAHQIRGIADEFLWLSDTLEESKKLSEALTSTIRSQDDKKQLIQHAFGSGTDDHNADTLHPLVSSVLADLTSQTWSHPRDLAETCEQLGLYSMLSAAQIRNNLEKVQKDLFDADMILRSNRQLRNALAGKSRSRADREHLVTAVFADSVAEVTMMLLRRLIARTPHGRLLAALRELRIATAQAQGKELAVVHSAMALSDEQMDRLHRILEEKCGRPVHIDTEVDPEVIGGMRIRLGADLFEGTLAASLQQARTRLAG